MAIGTRTALNVAELRYALFERVLVNDMGLRVRVDEPVLKVNPVTVLNTSLVFEIHDLWSEAAKGCWELHVGRWEVFRRW